MPDLPENERDEEIETLWLCPACGHCLPTLHTEEDPRCDKGCGAMIEIAGTADDLNEAVKAAKRPATTPPNLAEKLRGNAWYLREITAKGCDDLGLTERAAGCRGHALGKEQSADRLDNAIPPEVWGPLCSIVLNHEEDRIVEPDLSEVLASIDYVIAVVCKPEIAQQHGWEPRATDKDDSPTRRAKGGSEMKGSDRFTMADPSGPRARARRAVEAQLSHLETTDNPAEARDRALAIVALAAADDDLKWVREPTEVTVGLSRIVAWERQISRLIDRVEGELRGSEGERDLYGVLEGVASDLSAFVEEAECEGLITRGESSSNDPPPRPPPDELTELERG